VEPAITYTRTTTVHSGQFLEDEPDWTDVLRVVPIELDEREMSAN
jgi:hypothetical protein